MVRFRCMVQVCESFIQSCPLPRLARTHANTHTRARAHTSTRVEVALFRLLALAHQCARTLSPIRTRAHTYVRAQDTFDPEFYLDVYETVSADGVTRSLHSGRCAAHAFMRTDGPHRHISVPICLCLLAQIYWPQPAGQLPASTCWLTPSYWPIVVVGQLLAHSHSIAHPRKPRALDHVR